MVDDGSVPNQSIDDLPELYSHLDIKIIHVKNKWWVNPCIPLNIGFKEAVGDIIIIQNPECFHTGNIIGFVELNMKLNDYMVFGCYAIDQQRTQRLLALSPTAPNYFNEAKALLEPKANMACGKAPTPNKWYQHSVYRPAAFNFCSAIMREDLDDLGGFDERFGKGIAKDDKEFILRIKRKGMRIIQVDTPFVIHQYHHPFHYRQDLVVLNTALLEEWLAKDDSDYKVSNEFINIDYEVLT